ncbi:MAG TPA: radical SAM protein, partial [Candidatus Cloacimonadota bacterium]|nr:radical SAM protein [Candidatus Cloacimonadota bacterium]
PLVCEHIHLPMQSGADAILAKMNRKYNYEWYLGRIEALRTAIPEIAITTDLIAGFPSETDAEFEQTLNAIKEIGFDYAFCFKYSSREGTAACKFPDQIPEDVRLSRLKTMIDLQRSITLKKFQAQIGKTVEILAEDFSKKSPTQISGKTRDYKIAVLDGSQAQIGTLVKGRVIDATAGTLLCEPAC